jgi:hypothetical protein
LNISISQASFISPNSTMPVNTLAKRGPPKIHDLCIIYPEWVTEAINSFYWRIPGGN